MKDLQFKKFDNTVISDVSTYVKDWMKEHPYSRVIIGCDSQRHRRKIKYAVSVVMHDIDKYGVGHGAHVIYATYIEKLNRNEDMYKRLWNEAELSISAAEMIGDIGVKITIHLDYNSDEKAGSHRLCSAGTGFIESMGYEARVKPYAYVASYTSDSLCRN
jgi:predicted RNase H-related nuclease YkuK (DUF458 family)